MDSHAIYVHIPFCRHRCAYCDFNTYAGKENLIPDYVAALCREIETVGMKCTERIGAHSIFFGGGTPSLLRPDEFKKILTTLRANFDLVQPEISLEANPGTVDREALGELRELGFNRISFGVQSFQDEELRSLERIHSALEVFEAVRWTRRAGFDNLSLDLIYGLPEQEMERWADSLQNALCLQPEHLSLYALTIEEGTPLGRWWKRGLIPTPDEDLAAEMYEYADDILERNGYQQYEISNWSRPGKECAHNLTYWRNQPYLGFGAGAHGHSAGRRYSNVKRIATYIERMKLADTSSFPRTPATVDVEDMSPMSDMQETMMLGLRLTREGIAADLFQQRHGTGMMEVFGREIGDLVELGLVEWAENNLRLSRRGRLLGNQAFMRFVGSREG